MEDQSIQLQATPRTHLDNLYVTSTRPMREPQEPELLPAGASITMSEGATISFADGGAWAQGVFLKETTIEGPLVFAHGPMARLVDLAESYFADEQSTKYLGGLFGALGGFGLLIAFLSTNDESTIQLLGVLTNTVCGLVGLASIAAVSSAISTRRKVKRDPARCMRDHDAGRSYQVFLPDNIKLQGAA